MSLGFTCQGGSEELADGCALDKAKYYSGVAHVRGWLDFDRMYSPLKYVCLLLQALFQSCA
jgi:hypothetical protein